MFAFIAGCSTHHTETKLWKEKKWDKEPGAIIPLRKNPALRFWNYVVEYKYKPMLYYFGLFLREKDLDPQIDLGQFALGRKYRRFLLMEYSRRQSLAKFREQKYDFLEISPMYGKDSV